MRRSGFEKLGRWLLLAFGTGFALIGVRYFVDPALLTVETDVSMPSIKAVMEIRTVYGGMFIGLGLTVIALALRKSTVTSGLWVLVLTAACVALARILAIALGQAPDPFFAGLLAIEVVGVAVALVVLRGLGRNFLE